MLYERVFEINEAVGKGLAMISSKIPYSVKHGSLAVPAEKSHKWFVFKIFLKNGDLLLSAFHSSSEIRPVSVWEIAPRLITWNNFKLVIWNNLKHIHVCYFTFCAILASQFWWLVWVYRHQWTTATNSVLQIFQVIIHWNSVIVQLLNNLNLKIFVNIYHTLSAFVCLFSRHCVSINQCSLHFDSSVCINNI